MQVLPLLSSSSSNHWTIRLIELILDQKGITFYGFVVRNNGTFLFDFLAGGVKQRFGGWGRGRKEEDREKEREYLEESDDCSEAFKILRGCWGRETRRDDGFGLFLRGTRISKASANKRKEDRCAIKMTIYVRRHRYKTGGQ